MKVSILIPLFNSENVIWQCLESLLNQDFSEFEVIMINDGSCGKDDKKRNYKKIIKDFSKKNKLTIKYIEYNENRSLLEVRRNLLYEASGEYVYYVDSDDFLSPNTLSVMYSVAKENDADIVQGKSTTFVRDGGIQSLEQAGNARIKLGITESKEILNQVFIKKTISTFLWGKLIKKDLLMKAFDQIPYCECFMQEDLLIFFFVSLFAKKCIGIENVVYNYCSNGSNYHGKINNLAEWKKICTKATVFTVILDYVVTNPFCINECEKEEIKKLSSLALAKDIRTLSESVAKEMKEDAKEILNEYYGEEFVSRIEKSILSK